MKPEYVEGLEALSGYYALASGDFNLNGEIKSESSARKTSVALGSRR